MIKRFAGISLFGGCFRGRALAPSPRGPTPQDLVEVEMELAELPAVVPGADREHALTRRRLDGGPPRPGDGLLAGAVDDDPVRGVRAVHELGLDTAAPRRAKGVVGRGAESLVFRADLAAAPDDAVGARC